MNGNYIKIDRGILDWEWYSNTNTKAVFLHCLLKANWKEGKFEGQIIERGSFVTSVAKMSEELEMTPKQIRVALEHLKNTGEVAIKTTNKYSVITIKNYSLYQDEGKQTANKGQTKGKQTANKGQTKGNNRKKEKGKNEKKEEGNIKESFYPNDEKLDEAFRDFFEMRKAIKAPMTDRAVTLAQNKLAKLAQLPFSDQMDNDLAIEILNQSTMNSWKGLFPLKKQNEGNTLDEWRNAL